MEDFNVGIDYTAVWKNEWQTIAPDEQIQSREELLNSLIHKNLWYDPFIVLYIAMWSSKITIVSHLWGLWRIEQNAVSDSDVEF